MVDNVVTEVWSPTSSCPAALGEGLDNFVMCPLEALSWSRRKYLIMEEVLTYRPHIVCMQEVDHYYDTLQPVLAGLGYSSHFCPKPWSPCLGVEGNNGPDGCALFYDESRFELLDSVNIRLSAMRIPTNQVGEKKFFVRCSISGALAFLGKIKLQHSNSLLSDRRLP